MNYEELLYQLEEFTEMPPAGGRTATRKAFFIEFLAKIEKAGVRFVIKANEEYTLRGIIKEHYPEWKFRISKIEDNKQYKRVWRMA